jgi:hypothetical protein
MARKLEITLAICAALLAGVAGRAQDTTESTAMIKSRVVVVRDPSAVRGLTFDAEKIRAMVSKGIRALTKQDDDAAAWATLVSSNDVVGIKIATQGAPLQVTRRELVDAIAAGLQAAGVATTNILVWDRDGAKMRAAGYKTNRDGPGMRVLSVVPDTGWDETIWIHNSLVGKLIWGDLLFGRPDTEFSNISHLPKILTQEITKLINVPVLQDHETCGISGCLYNLSLGAVDNMRRFETGGFRGDPIVGEIFKQPQINGKLVLNVMDGLVGGFAAGPAFKPQFSWNYGGLCFSRDPVAIDILALELINERRMQENLVPIGARASHVISASRTGLGQFDLDRIEQIDISTSPGKTLNSH